MSLFDKNTFHFISPKGFFTLVEREEQGKQPVQLTLECSSLTPECLAKLLTLRREYSTVSFLSSLLEISDFRLFKTNYVNY